ncbi:MAG: type II secretion system protein GspN [Pseudomonadota bacterium]
MGLKFLKLVAYVGLFVFSFVLFLYWFFPYEVLKDRITGAIEQQLGGGVEVDMKDLKPYWFTGVDVSGLTIGAAGGGGKAAPLVECKRVRARASFFSLLFGRPSVSFDIKIGKGEIFGSASQSDEVFSVDADLDGVDLGNFKFIPSSTGLSVSSKISGSVVLHVDRQNPANSTGSLSLSLPELKVAASEVKLGEMAVPLPDFVISNGRESRMKLDVGKGTITLENFKLSGGDLGVDLKGKVFLSTKLENYRFNLNGSFTVSKKLSDALPFLFIVEQQKQQDGSYPLSVTGRIVKPTIKVGTFTVPM